MLMSDVISNIKNRKTFKIDLTFSIVNAPEILEIIDKTINSKCLCFDEKALKEFQENCEIDAVFGTNGYKVKFYKELCWISFNFIEGGLEWILKN